MRYQPVNKMLYVTSGGRERRSCIPVGRGVTFRKPFAGVSGIASSMVDCCPVIRGGDLPFPCFHDRLKSSFTARRGPLWAV
jgi:hypothetical protein